MKGLGLRTIVIFLLVVAVGLAVLVLGRDEGEPDVRERISEFLLILSPDNFSAGEMEEITTTLDKFNLAWEREMIEDSTVNHFVDTVDSLLEKGEVETADIQRVMVLVGKAINRRAEGEGTEPGQWIRLRGHPDTFRVQDRAPEPEPGASPDSTP
jgi:hypothetical protein